MILEGLDIIIDNNIRKIKEDIKNSLEKSGRTKEVTLLAVTKNVEVEKIQEAIDLGIEDIGENRVQELQEKYNEVNRQVNYHMIGHLQTNKVKYIIDKVKLIHSLDRISLCKELDKRAKAHGIKVDVLIQMNIAKEKTKFGLYENEIVEFVEKLVEYENIQVRGLMTMAPHTDDEKVVRKVFRDLYNIKEDLSNRNYDHIKMDYLSMGMTNDYKIAIEEGSNIIRVGSGIFGSRKY